MNTDLVLGFNNDTIKYGMAAYQRGMTKAEFKNTLIQRGFVDNFADLFVKEYYWQGEYAFVNTDGRGSE